MKLSRRIITLVGVSFLSLLLHADESSSNLSTDSDNNLQIKIEQKKVVYYRNSDSSILVFSIKNMIDSPMTIVMPEEDSQIVPVEITLVGADNKKTITIPMDMMAFGGMSSASEGPEVIDTYDISPGENIQILINIHNIFLSPTYCGVRDLKAGEYRGRLCFIRRDGVSSSTSDEFILVVKDIPSDILKSYQELVKDYSPKKALEFFGALKDKEMEGVFAYDLFKKIMCSAKVKLSDINPSDFEPMIPGHLKSRFAFYCYILEILKGTNKDELLKQKNAIIEKYPEMKWWLSRVDSGECPILMGIKAIRHIRDEK